MKAITGESFIPISLEYAVEYWGLMALKGNKLALNLLLACAAETLERRLDSAFGVKKSQEQYNQDMSLRMQQMAISKKWFSILATRYEKLYGRAPTQTYLDYWNETVNLALFNTPSFSDGTDNMTEDQRMKILNFESLCIHMSNKYRFSTPEFLIGKALTCLS
jgi:hypothetical protein